jgi:xanthine/CO dehydrogenase XdhC/CoxF family maturation factor
MSTQQPLRLEDADVLGLAEDWVRAGRGVALAPVVGTWGWAPRPGGSHHDIDADGHFEGSV